jgi:predicted metal-dependent peptidase
MSKNLSLPEQEKVKLVKPVGNEKQRLVKARTTLVMTSPFFGLLSLRMKLVEAPWIITCGTDGKHHYYNPAYIAGLTDDEVVGIWVHEVLHITNGHPWRRGQREKGKWNWACDYAIDPLGKDAGYTIPNETINPAWKGWAAEQIYTQMPEKYADKPQDGAGGQPGQGSGDPRAPKGIPSKGQVLDAEESTAQADQAEWKQAIASAAAQAKAQGKLPSNMEIYIEEMLAPKVDWKSVLARFVQNACKSDYDWRLPNRSYQGMGMYLPRIYSESVGPIVFGWDTSGSHYDKHTQESTAAEVTEIIRSVNPEKVFVAYCDAALQGEPLEIEPGDDPKWKPKGGGGTSFVPVFDWVKESGVEPVCMIYMTDCYGDFPKEVPPYPVLWLSTVDPAKLPEQYRPPFGDLLFLDLSDGE